MHTGDADVVAEDETAGGGDEAGEEDESRHVARVDLAPRGAYHHAARHRCGTGRRDNGDVRMEEVRRRGRMRGGA